jgi:arginase family enzyme
MTMRKIAVIGAATSAGSHHAGQEHAPAALRAAGFVTRLEEAGLDVEDLGDVAQATFTQDQMTATARNLATVVEVASTVADAVAGALSAGRLPIALGGDCTITLGVIAGVRRKDVLAAHPDLVHFSGPAARADPDRLAAEAAAAITAGADGTVVHFDVDAVDSRDLPLANFPHYGVGMPLATAARILTSFCRLPRLRAVVLTEVNPSYEPSGTALARYTDAVTGAALTNVPAA